MIEKDEFGEKTFYGKYYSHLGLSKYEAEFIYNQLVEFHDKIEDIVLERTVADKYNIYLQIHIFFIKNIIQKIQIILKGKIQLANCG